MKCCKLLLHEIVFSFGAIHPCCSHTISKTDSQLMLNYHGEILDLQDHIAKRQKFIDIFNSGEVPECYNNCNLYEENKNVSNKLYFDVINVSNRTKCSCNCIYCDLCSKGDKKKKQELNSLKPYDIKPVLTDIKNKNLINNNCYYLISGGECSEYPKEELEWLLLFSMLINSTRIEILSSGINYSEVIAKALKVADVEIKISVDSGCKKTYEKIKQVKAYDKVWRTLAKYVKAAQNNNKAKVVVKYIIIPGINDNIQEAEAFIKKCKSINAKNISIDIEHYFLYEKGSEFVTESLKETVRYFENLRKNSIFNVEYIQVGKEFLKGII